MSILFKNNKNEQLNIYISEGVSLEIAASGQLDVFTVLTREQLSNADDVAYHIKQGDITVNDGVNDLDWLSAIDLCRDYRQVIEQPKKTSDNDWHFVNENFAHVSGNKGINWAIEKYLEPGSSYSEYLKLPEGRHATLNFMEGGSYLVPSHISLEWYEWCPLSSGYVRHNPWMRSSESYALTLSGEHASNFTVLSVNEEFEHTLEEIETDLVYCFHAFDSASGYFPRKIVSVNASGNTITVDPGIPFDCPDGTKIGLVDRPIGQIGNQIASSILNWTSPPNEFFGNDKNYFKFTVTNEDPENSGLVTATVNGWHTDTENGD